MANVAQGQFREAEDRSEWIEILHVYGYGSSGGLYAVTVPCTRFKSPSGMGSVDIEAKYPRVIDVGTVLEERRVRRALEPAR